MTIARRLYLLLLSVALVLAALTALATYEMNKVYTSAQHANINTVPRLTVLEGAFSGVAQARTELWQYMAQKDEAKKAALLDSMNSALARSNAAMDQYEKKLGADEADRRLFGEIRAAMVEFEALRQTALALVKDGKNEQAQEYISSNAALLARLSTHFEAGAAHDAALAKRSAEDAATTLRNSIVAALTISLLTLAAIAALVVRAAAAAGTLQEQVDQLAQTLAAFTLDVMQVRPRPAARADAPPTVRHLPAPPPAANPAARLAAAVIAAASEKSRRQILGMPPPRRSSPTKR